MNSTKEKSNKNISKRRLQVTLAIVAGVLILMLITVWILDMIVQKQARDNASETVKFQFYPADYSENIFEDPEYMELSGNGILFYYTNSAIEQGVLADKADLYGEEVAFFADYIQHMINGNVQGYNDCHSEFYYKTHEPKNAFTMQKMYDIRLKFYSTEQVSDKDNNYTKSIYILEYYILENNGTLRDDFLEGYKPQYITVTNREGRILIDSVETVRYR